MDTVDVFKARILIVDDQDANVDLLERTLANAGYVSVASTTDPRQVCDLHRANRYDLIVLDLQMPQMDGFEVLEGLKQLEKPGFVSVLVITAQPAHKARALRAGAKDFVAKPFDLAEVLARVHNLLEVRLYANALERSVEQLVVAAQEKDDVQRQLLGKIDELRLKAEMMSNQERRLGQMLLTERRLSARLDTANQELDRFAYATSHDLKAPLRGIMNLTGWIEDDLGALAVPEVKTNLALIHNRARRLESLIDGMLTYARAGRVLATAEPVDTTLLLREIADLLAPPANVRVELIAPLPSFVAERIPLQQIFMNLVQNAIKHGCRAGGNVEVSCREDEHFYSFSVADTGPGIAPEYHSRVFDIFQTLASRDEVEGSGIGLSVVKKLVETRGGAVTLSSMPGEGATFRFTWPRQPQTA